MDIPVFVFTGFIDSGKTTLIRETMESEDFIAYRNLLICCEEGDEEYDEEFLKRNHCFIHHVDKEEDLTAAYFKKLASEYDPDQVMIEYNGTWKMASLFSHRLPKNWQWAGVFSTVDTTTADMYLGNMRQLFMEQFSESGLIIFNRCDEDVDRMRLRRIFKGFNPAAQLVFEREDGEMYDPADDPLPFDISGQEIEIDDLDYGVWYIDAMDHPDRYMGKDICFLAQAYTGPGIPKDTFVPGRFVMTCCIEDVRFAGYICAYNGKFRFKQRDWLKVKARFGFGFDPDAGEEVPNLTLISAEPAQPAEVDPIFFN